MRRVCFHGAESTGKSVLAKKLSRELGLPWVPEYGRGYCEAKFASGPVELDMDDLLAIAGGQDAMMASAAASAPPLLILDTDPLMTAAWAQMVFGRIPPALFSFEKAEHYLVFAADVPWVADGSRFFGAPLERARFAAVAEDVLVRAGVPYTRISGDWAAREAEVRRVLA